jgi:aminopeptidase-like protein
MTDTRGTAMHGLVDRLYPICRSITGDGVRETLRHVGGHIPLAIHEVPTGTPAFDWTVPREWNVRDASVTDGDGRRVIDFREHSLHLMSYSVPVDARMGLDALRPHLHTLPAQPDLVPYRTSYYNENWGFCLSQRQLDALPDGEYHVQIDSTLAEGSLTYGECVIPGAEQAEFLLTCHICHPSLANDNLSGIAVLTWLGRELAVRSNRFTYRLLFIPGTIGSLTWLSRNEAVVDRVRHGLTLAGVGDAAALTYKRSRRGTADIDRAVGLLLRDRDDEARIEDFSPYGYDERQFCSPGFDMPVGCLMRSPHNTYPEYHTSADDPSFVQPASLTDTLEFLLSLIELLERNGHYRNMSPKGEPQLGKRGLYPSMGGPSARDEQLAMLWVMNQSDGAHSLLDIAERSGMPAGAIVTAAERLAATDLLASPVARSTSPTARVGSP